ncbi:hypothetical protein [Pseudoxanthomonas wuyuanensis]|uniref:Uncharacterized protein n=1 Tax=Pseudoxanthomonas wuyuanensis TaxID=1073196 RepID=A0A286CV22_9GAMM|nr:hypothetical protein [Pseudoxanthomonas wuyuanensis]KAF1717348.1 hypothetical protein CSC75_18405 [Pseudoxanthomonas wuyuanensis]SOD50257.1 hypothetical protein SAMN06296416_10121 [Pseudoxanthomonas wuyuanensis]
MLDPQILHQRASRVLPIRLQTTALMSDADGAERPDAMRLLIRRCRSGAIRFRLATETLAGLAQAPLDYLKQATTAREGLGRRRPPLRYGPWQTVAAPHGMGFVTCSVDGRATLWLIPGQQLAVYGWNDRGLCAGWEAGPWTC